MAEEKQMARVVKRLKGNDQNPHGAPYNPILDQSKYLVEFSDGTTKEIYANLIAESMFSDIDSEGHHYRILKEITGHNKKDDAIKKKDVTINHTMAIKYQNPRLEVGNFMWNGLMGQLV